MDAVAKKIVPVPVPVGK